MRVDLGSKKVSNTQDSDQNSPVVRQEHKKTTKNQIFSNKSSYSPKNHENIEEDLKHMCEKMAQFEEKFELNIEEKIRSMVPILLESLSNFLPLKAVNLCR